MKIIIVCQGCGAPAEETQYGWVCPNCGGRPMEREYITAVSLPLAEEMCQEIHF